MFAAHDQENLVSIHHTAANTKQQQNARTLQPKTPGARYPKTPLKVPLNDENNTRAFGAGKSVLGINNPKLDRSQFVTPGEPRTGRPILGDKTTNAKARRGQPTAAKTPAVRELDGGRTQQRPKSFAPKAGSSNKLQILLDHSDPLSDDVDTNPEPPPEEPYQSDVWPAGVITFEAAKPANRMKGYYDWYHNRRDENGETRVDREMKARQEVRFRDADALIRKEIDEMTFDLGLESPMKKRQLQQPMLVPQDPNKKVVRSSAAAKATAPSTLNSRRAASALGMAPLTTSATAQRKLLADKALPSYMQPTRARQPQQPPSTGTMLTSRPKTPGLSTTAGVAASRSTLGYNKGRTALGALNSHVRSISGGNYEAAPRSRIARAETTTTVSRDGTITPASYARDTAEAKPGFMSIFDVRLDEEDADLFGPGAGVEELFEGEEEEAEFEMDLQL